MWSEQQHDGADKQDERTARGEGTADHPGRPDGVGRCTSDPRSEGDPEQGDADGRRVGLEGEPHVGGDQPGGKCLDDEDSRAGDDHGGPGWHDVADARCHRESVLSRAEGGGQDFSAAAFSAASVCSIPRRLCAARSTMPMTAGALTRRAAPRRSTHASVTRQPSGMGSMS